MKNEPTINIQSSNYSQESLGYARVEGPNRFVSRRLIRFGDCDPAGIVFYPKYINILHEVTEDWWLRGVGIDVNHMIRSGFGWPLVNLETSFRKPSFSGDMVSFELSISKIGRTSLGTHICCRDDKQIRLEAHLVQVLMDMGSHRPAIIPASVRERLEAFQGGCLENIDLELPIPIMRNAL